MTFSTLKVEVRDSVHLVYLNRPERINAMNLALTQDLLNYFEARRRDWGTRVILLAGAGRGYCAGADLRPDPLGGAGSLEQARHGDWIIRDAIKAIRDCPQPVISLVHGAAAGAGFALALAGDILVAGRSAVFHPSFHKVGLSGSELGLGWRLQRTIGISRARAMLLTGRAMPAQEALQAGLVSAVVDDDQLLDYGLAMAQDMLASSPEALRLTKRSLDVGLEIPGLNAAMEMEERAQVLSMERAARVAISNAI